MIIISVLFLGYEKNIYYLVVGSFDIIMVVIADLIFICLLNIAKKIEDQRFKQRFKCLPLNVILLSLSAFSSCLIHGFQYMKKSDYDRDILDLLFFFAYFIFCIIWFVSYL